MHHAELVASKWQIIQSPNKVLWYKDRINKLTTVAVFSKADPAQPVAWIMQYASGELGSLFTLESHRRKGLGLAVTAAMCRAVLDKYPDIPPHCTIVEKTTTFKLFEKLGFVDSHIQSYFSI